MDKNLKSEIFFLQFWKDKISEGVFREEYEELKAKYPSFPEPFIDFKDKKLNLTLAKLLLK